MERGGTIFYDFHSEWHIEGTVQEVDAILSDPVSCRTWWRANFLRIEVLEPGGKDRVGCVVRFFSKGYLPYVEQVLFKVIEAEPLRGFTVRAAGDFNGWASCEFREVESGQVHVVSDWVIEAIDPLLRAFSPVARPLFATNHRYVMAQGEIGLQREIRRRRGDANVPPPPQPTFPHNMTAVRARLKWKPWTASWEKADSYRG